MVLKSGEVIVLEAEEGIVEVLKAVCSSKTVKKALKGANKYRPHRPE